MRFQGFETSCSPSFEPLTHGSFTDSQCFRDILLFPMLFFQTPGAFAPFFSPIGFLWCSHASYFSILYLLPPRSVSAEASPVGAEQSSDASDHEPVGPTQRGHSPLQ